MKRFASIDFLRGYAIWMMVFVHTLMRWADQDTISGMLDQLPMFIFVFLLAAIFFGGWAGFFLMISAVGNMVSMYRSTKRLGRPGDVILKQVIGGILLYFFAILTESVLGYHGYLGEIALGNLNKWDIVLYRGFHMETIHTVAVCVILNALVQGILSINNGWKKTKRNIRIYIVLAILVILASVFVWEGVDMLVPGFRYPFEQREFVYRIFGKYLQVDNGVQYGYLGYDSIWQLTKLFFLMPLAGGPEPIFPFLAVSFVGSVVGLYLTKKQEEREENPEKLPSTRPLTKGMILSFILFLIGLIGVALLAVFSNLEIVPKIISHHYDVRRLYEDGLVFGGGAPFWKNSYSFLWLFWFLMVTGAQLGCLTLLIRVVEFRGKAKQFGRKTLYFRRFGHVPFSIYNYQFVDIIMVLIFALVGYIFPVLGIPGANQVPNGYAAILSNGTLDLDAGAFTAFGPIHIWFLIAGVFLVHQVLLKLWEKAHYTGGLEWAIAKMANFLIPSKRKERVREGFFRTERLNPKKGLITPEWIEIVPYDKVQHEDLVDSKFASKLCWLGIVIPPLSLVSLGISRTALKTEGKNKYSKRGLIVSIIAVALSAIIIALLFVFKGIAL
ncbi:MAG: hypothetical protein JW776_16190 [Candidatus Lokiarchaeota archaeon]|nr:hypothetical protein [Candidatus Lokiarchaeota archaeon]